MDRHLTRRCLLLERDLLLLHYHDAIECADAELDSCELEEGMRVAQLWEIRVIALLGEEADQLRGVLAALGRLDDGSYGTCIACHGRVDETSLALDPTRVYCDDCAVTSVMCAVTPTDEPSAGAPPAR